MSLISSRIPEHPYVPSSARYAQTRSEKPHFGLLRFLKRCFLIGLIAILILNLGQYAHSQRYAWFPKRWGTVIPEKVFRSGQLSESIVESMLAMNQIQVILDLNGKDIYDPEQCEELVAAEKLGIEVHRFQLCGDGTGDLDRYANAVALVDQTAKENKRLLVHCSAGTKRTGGGHRLLPPPGVKAGSGIRSG